MTEPAGFAESVARYTAELDGAVVRARKVASEARETSAKFRRETRQLAEKVRSGPGRVEASDLTDDGLRRSASGFRADNGLPVEKLPSGAELLLPPAQRAPASPAAEPSTVLTGPPAPVPPVTPRSVRSTGSGRHTPRPSDDDEDFSQQRIMW